MKRTLYANIADKYDKNTFRTQEIKTDTELEDYIRKSTQPQYKVLDLSCGTGLYLQKQTEYFTSSSIQWFGLDASEEMLAKAKEKVGNFVSFHHGRAENLPFENETFDYIVNNYAFHHYENKEKAIDEISRVLRKGGVYKLHNIAIHDMPQWWVYHYFPTARMEDLKRFWSKELLYHELSQRGFDVNLQIQYKMLQAKIKGLINYADNRDISVLTLICEEDYQEGLAKMKYDLKANPEKKIVVDFAELVCLARKGERL
ncbi:class I SAM-dependent methyltransferase [Sutcliffiella rhizosphaerae]|uniref:2-methoxy-6-polyprenyl-1,4-benzoquinol methylase, mitochondrial n=1 Tax=Sutcliffiella rhizosphaerae TaxID=2880967 RepID=A0ABN8AB93_9BACI|nr:class I SAM-dependent methyltransferase [Sutcliffiella rhizosphaerae]CAG9622464.1 2-methoxy-6-polyprenyl-1,4-benzoquinol methylase, mitochondrial [Sutcliffiella rhizosphaerae]